MHYKLVKLNTARNSLRYIIKAFDINELYLPYYICPSLRICLKNESCKLIYYHIDNKFSPICEFPDDAFILYPNYFGICSHIVDELAGKYKNLIVDNAHSFFSVPKGIASFSSLRKFFPKLRNGSFLYTLKLCKNDFETDSYIYPIKDLTEKEFITNENYLDTQGIMYISDCTLQAFKMLDIEYEKKKRIALFNALNDLFNCSYKLDPNDIPMAFPLFSKNREQTHNIVKMFEKAGIDVYRYWNNLPKNYPEKDFYLNLLVISLNVEELPSFDINPEYMSEE